MSLLTSTCSHAGNTSCWYCWLLVLLAAGAAGCWCCWLLVLLAAGAAGCWCCWLLVLLAAVGGLEALDEMVILGILLALNFRVLLVFSVMTRLVLFLELTCRYDCAIEEVS